MLLLLLLCVCVRVRVKTDIPGADMQGSGSAERAGSSGRQARAAGVEEGDEVSKIMKQKILNNLFSLSAVVPHVARPLSSSHYTIEIGEVVRSRLKSNVWP